MINHKTFSATPELERLEADYGAAIDALADLFDAFGLDYDRPTISPRQTFF